MIFKRLNRTSAEQVFAVFQANEAGIGANDVVALELTAGSADGVKIVEPNSNELNAVVGIADAAIGNGSYGLVQIYGYRSTSKIEKSGSSIALGQALTPRAGSDVLAYAGNLVPVSGLLPTFFAMETLASSAGATHTDTIKIFIRMM